MTCGKKRSMEKKIVEYSLSAKKTDFSRFKVTSSKDAVDLARRFYGDDILVYESAFIILMNQGGIVTGYAKISQGGLCGTVVDNVIVAKYAIDCMAKSVILVHNHPSGNPAPSVSDIEVASKVRKALSVFDIRLLDSIILTDVEYRSMSDGGGI